jgi:hypothetical protein
MINFETYKNYLVFSDASAPWPWPARALCLTTIPLVTHPKDAQLQQEFSALQQVGVKPALKVA